MSPGFRFRWNTPAACARQDLGGVGADLGDDLGRRLAALGLAERLEVVARDGNPLTTKVTRFL